MSDTEYVLNQYLLNNNDLQLSSTMTEVFQCYHLHGPDWLETNLWQTLPSGVLFCLVEVSPPLQGTQSCSGAPPGPLPNTLPEQQLSIWTIPYISFINIGCFWKPCALSDNNGKTPVVKCEFANVCLGNDTGEESEIGTRCTGQRCFSSHLGSTTSHM